MSNVPADRAPRPNPQESVHPTRRGIGLRLHSPSRKVRFPCADPIRSQDSGNDDELKISRLKEIVSVLSRRPIFQPSMSLWSVSWQFCSPSPYALDLLVQRQCRFISRANCAAGDHSSENGSMTGRLVRNLGLVCLIISGCREDSIPVPEPVTSRQATVNERQKKGTTTGIRFQDRATESQLRIRYQNDDEHSDFAILESLGGGVAVFDFDGDQFLDLFVPQGGTFREKLIAGRSSVLLRGSGVWKFDDVTELARISESLSTWACIRRHSLHWLKSGISWVICRETTGFTCCTIWLWHPETPERHCSMASQSWRFTAEIQPLSRF